MKSFSIDQTLSLIKVSRTLLNLKGLNMQQLSRPQKINSEILKGFLKREKKVMIIADDYTVYSTYAVKVSEKELVLRLPDLLKLSLNTHLLVVFPTDEKEYVVQTFVQQVFAPMVVLSYADPRQGKRWRLNEGKEAAISVISETISERLISRHLHLVRLVDRIHPEKSAFEIENGNDEVSIGVPISVDQHTSLIMKDFICSSVEVLPGTEAGDDEIVVDYQEDERIKNEIAGEQMNGQIRDISPSGFAVIARKGAREITLNTLVSIDFPPFQLSDQAYEFNEFKLSLYGIVRHIRDLNKKDLQFLGIKFIKANGDPRFLNLLEKIAS